MRGFVVLVGLAALTMLGWATAGPAAQRIEQAVQTAAGEALRGSGADWARVAVDGREARLTGRPPSAADRQAAIERLDALPGVRRVVDDTSAD